MILLDDVTERRALELKLTGCRPNRRSRHPGPTLPAATVGQLMPRPSRSSARRLGRHPACAPPGTWWRGSPRRRASGCRCHQARCSAAPQAARIFPTRCACRSRAGSEAMLIAKDGQLIFANPAAAQFFRPCDGRGRVERPRHRRPLRPARPIAAGRRHRHPDRASRSSPRCRCRSSRGLAARPGNSPCAVPKFAGPTPQHRAVARSLSSEPHLPAAPVTRPNPSRRTRSGTEAAAA